MTTTNNNPPTGDSNMSTQPVTIKIDDTTYVCQDFAEASSPSAVQIVIADRGWVFIGRTTNTDEGVTITNAQNVRYWGTAGKGGLGHLAQHGPTDKTQLDEYGTVRIPAGSIVAVLDADCGKWSL